MRIWKRKDLQSTFVAPKISGTTCEKQAAFQSLFIFLECSIVIFCSSRSPASWLPPILPYQSRGRMSEFSSKGAGAFPEIQCSRTLGFFEAYHLWFSRLDLDLQRICFWFLTSPSPLWKRDAADTAKAARRTHHRWTLHVYESTQYDRKSNYSCMKS